MGGIVHKVKLMSRGSTETELDVATMFVLLEHTTCSTPTSSVHRPSIVLSLQEAGALGRKKKSREDSHPVAAHRPTHLHITIESGHACPPASGRMPAMARRQPSCCLRCCTNR